MKGKFLIMFAWVAGTFLLLAWVTNAPNHPDRGIVVMRDETDGPPSQAFVGAVDAYDRQSREIKYVANATRHNVEARIAADTHSRMIGRVWVLWGVAATVPLLFLWWAQLAGLWRRRQTRFVGEPATPSTSGATYL